MSPLLAPEPVSDSRVRWPALPDLLSAEAQPRCLDARTSGAFLSVHADRLTASYTGTGSHDNDCGGCVADAAVPADLPLFYFELEVQRPGARGTVGIGLTDGSHSMTRQPGWESGCYGYHGDDGKAYHASGRGVAYGPVFGAHDVVGCGLLLSSGTVFFTKNGVHLGVAFRGAKLPLWPSVGLHSPGERVTLNFGADPARPFAYDLRALLRAEQAEERHKARGVDLPAGAALQLVRQFLAQQGHARTLAALGDADSERIRQDVALRGAVRGALLRGDYAGAAAGVEAIAERSPLSVCPRARVDAALTTLRFLEDVRGGNAVGAVTAALAALKNSEQRPSGEAHEELNAALKRLSPLLCYPVDAAPQLAWMLAPAQREALADCVNEALLCGQQQLQTPPLLQAALQQLVATQRARRLCAGEQGAMFDLHQEVTAEARTEHGHGAGDAARDDDLLD